jgi:predicted dehydrogenase
MTLRVGIISAAWGTMAHLPAWRSLPGVEVTSVCTSRQATAEAACEKHGIQRPFWDAAAMVSDPSIDIIDCGTRPSVRHSMVLSGLRNGKHVYNGIPFAADLEAARSLHGAWKDNGNIAVVDAYSEWLPAHRLAKEMIDAGYLGQPFGGTCIFNMSLFNRPNPQFPYNWFAQRGLGVSAVRNLGSHALHLLIHLFGPIEELVAHDAQLLPEWRFPDGQVVKSATNDFANLMLRFASGLMIQVQISWNAPLGRGWHLEAFGSKGRLVAAAPSFPTSLQTTLHAGTLDSGSMEQIKIPDRFLRSADVGIDASVPMPPAYPMALSMSAMVRAIEGQGPARPDFDQAWAVERVLEAVRRSSAERRWVELASIV